MWKCGSLEICKYANESLITLGLCVEVWKSGMTVVFKRSRNVGYAGIDNPLFYKDNNKMFFGDASASIDSIIDSLKTL